MNTENRNGNHLPDPIRDVPAQKNYIHDPEFDLDGRVFYLGEGESPFGPPPQYREIRRRLEEEGKFTEAGEHYKQPDVDRGIRNIREMHGLSEKPYIVFSAGGSDEILERSMWLLKQKKTPRGRKTLISGFGPHFPNIVNFAKRFEEFKTDISYGPQDISLISTFEYAVDTALEKRRLHPSDTNYVYYLCNPSTPKGEIMEAEHLERLLGATKNDLVVVDEAFGGILEENESAMRHTQTQNNLIVLGTLSKAVGIPGERIGYAVMSPEIGEAYEKLRRPYDIPGPTQLLINEITNPEILVPHLENVKTKTKEVKTALLAAFEKYDIRVLPTSDRTPICLIDGMREDFLEQLNRYGVDAASGLGFSETFYPEEKLSNRYARITIPSTTDDIREIALRIKSAIVLNP